MSSYTPEETRIKRMINEEISHLKGRVLLLEQQAKDLKAEVHTLKFPLE